MQQFSMVVRALRNWIQSIGWVRPVLPYHLYLLFGGLGIMFLQMLLTSFNTMYTFGFVYDLFYVFPLAFIGRYAFLLGAWFTLVSSNVKYLPYALWGNALLILLPFYSLSIYDLLETAIYSVLGYFLYQYVHSPYAKSAGKSSF